MAELDTGRLSGVEIAELEFGITFTGVNRLEAVLEDVKRILGVEEATESLRGVDWVEVEKEDTGCLRGVGKLKVELRERKPSPVLLCC